MPAPRSRTFAARLGRHDDGSYRLTGTKMWISGGDHELAETIVHLVLAKLPGAPPGVRGISLFAVPRDRVGGDATVGEPNDVRLAGLNHKMGWRGTTNAVLSFGERGDCRAELVGEAHRGLEYMFQMMNAARIGVGTNAVALGYAAYLEALAYARERPQGRPRRREGSRRRRRSRSCATPTCAGCCSRRNAGSRAASRSCFIAPGLRTRSARPWTPPSARVSGGFSSCSRRSPNPGPRNSASRPTSLRSRCTAATATRAIFRSSGCIATIA